MSNQSTPETSTTTAQLANARLKQWHQQDEALLTLENLRAFVNAAGLVLFAPRPQIAAPAPSLVEAVLGATNPDPTLDQIAEARALLGRLTAEGLAVPLNLLGAGPVTVHAGAPGDTPDFVASTAVFSFVFTLRGDKAWKQPPATAGALKVSNLALATYEALTRRGPLSAYDLTTEVGKEVTEAAVLRALGELWTHLRVLPLPQTGGAAALWELAAARFTKQIKAGANAGQPSALSALISLYLGQAVVATEDEIESFLSPLAPRSRIRDVVHALLSARELDTIAIEGRTVLHVAGALPAFLPESRPETSQPQAIVAVGAEAAVETNIEGMLDAGEAPARITKFIPTPRKIGTGYLAKAKPSKFAAKAFDTSRSAPRPSKAEAGSRPDFKPGFKDRPKFKAGFKPRADTGAAPERERRPFRKPTSPGFDKPWQEEKPRRFSKPPERQDGEARPPRKTFSQPGTFGRKREGFDGEPSFGDQSRPPRQDFVARPDRAGRGERPSAGGPRAESRAPGSYSPRPRADRPQRPGGSGFAPKKRFESRPPDSRPNFSRDKPGERPRASRDRGPEAETGKRVYRKFDAPKFGARKSDAPRERGDRPARPFSSSASARGKDFGRDARKPTGESPRRSFSAGKPGEFPRKSGPKSGPRPGGSFAGKKAFAKSSKPGAPISGPFAKFAGSKKPFGNRPPGRKFKPSKGDSA